MRVFLDTNVLVSDLATRGLCADLYERLLTEHEIVIGEPVVAEVLDVLKRVFLASVDLLIKVKAELRLLQVVSAQATAPELAIKDFDGPWIIACALVANVGCFVMGDAKLLALCAVDKLPIISLRDCWNQMNLV